MVYQVRARAASNPRGRHRDLWLASGGVLKLVLPKGSLERATFELFEAADSFDTRFASSHKADVYSIGRTFRDNAIEPIRNEPLAAFSPQTLALERRLAADDPDQRPTAGEARQQLEGETNGREQEAEQLLRTLAAQRIARALPMPPTDVAGAEAQ